MWRYLDEQFLWKSGAAYDGIRSLILLRPALKGVVWLLTISVSLSAQNFTSNFWNDSKSSHWDFMRKICSGIGQNLVDMHFVEVYMGSSWNRTASVVDQIEHSSGAGCLFVMWSTCLPKIHKIDVGGPQFRPLKFSRDRLRILLQLMLMNNALSSVS